MPSNDDNFSVEAINQTFRTMVLEVSKQIDDTLSVLTNSKNNLIDKVSSRDDYIDNLKASIEKKCFCSNIDSKQGKETQDYLRAINIIASNLEHISDYSECVVSQVQFLEHYEIIKQYEYSAFFSVISTGLDNTVKAIKNKDMNLALAICRGEYYLDCLFNNNLEKIIDALGKNKHIKSLVTILFIFDNLERMGDALLNIGEAIISYMLGEKLKIHDFEALEESMVSFNENNRIKDIKLKTMWDTKSGCRTTQVNGNSSQDKGAIFKEGKIKKIEKELENIKIWEELQPGLPPKVFSFQKCRKSAAMLVEYLNGYNLQQLLIGHESNYLKKAIDKLKKTVVKIWNDTKDDSPINAGYMKQISSRSDDIVKAHPDIDISGISIGSLTQIRQAEVVSLINAISYDFSPSFFSTTSLSFNR